MAVSFLSKSEMQVILPTADCFLRMCVYLRNKSKTVPSEPRVPVSMKT